MKIYIATADSHSDYHIVEVFTKKESAEWYAAHNTDVDIEEYDNFDDCSEVLTVYVKKTAFARIDGYDNGVYVVNSNGIRISDDYYFTSKHRLSVPDRNKYVHSTFRCRPDSEFCFTQVFSVISRTYRKDHCPSDEKFIKIASDYVAIICAKLNEGFSVDQVNELFEPPNAPRVENDDDYDDCGSHITRKENKNG